jgi:hypothetical protein
MQVARGGLVGERVDDLLARPPGAGGVGDVAVHDASSFVARTTNTYSKRNVAVGTTKKSIAAARGIWLARNVRHVCDGGVKRRGMARDTVASLTAKPSLSNSPWMRGAPQPTLSRAICRMRLRISAALRGRPPRLWLFQLQYRANPLRCQRITVAGCTIVKAVRHSGHTRASTTQNARSARLSLGRFTWCRSTASCCRSARFSSASARRDLRLDRAAASTANKSVLMVRGACAQPWKPQGSREARGFEDPQVLLPTPKRLAGGN